MYNRFKNLKNIEKGQGMTEYALILVLVPVVTIVALMLLGPLVGNVFSSINSSVSIFGGGNENNGAATNGNGGEQDFGSTQWKNGWDEETPINNYCTSEGTGAGYNFYSVNEYNPTSGSYSYYIASGYPQPSSPNSTKTFLRTGTCP